MGAQRRSFLNELRSDIALQVCNAVDEAAYAAVYAMGALGAPHVLEATRVAHRQEQPLR